MKSKQPPRPSKKDEDWQKKIEERIKVEKVEIEHPKGKERFIAVIKQLGKKKKRS